MKNPTPVAVSVWLYRCIVFAYPAAYRRAYGRLMVQVFRDQCLQAQQTGLAKLWAHTLWDYALSLAAEYSRLNARVPSSTWIRLSGWGLSGSGFLYAAGMAAASRPPYHPANADGWAIDAYLNGLPFIFIPVAFVFMSAGMIGLLARFRSQAGSLGRACLWLGAAAGLCGALGAFGLGIADQELWWGLYFAGFLAINLALLLFSVAGSVERLFTHRSTLLLSIGAPIGIFVLLLLEMNGWKIPQAWMVAVFSLFAAGTGVIGWQLKAEAGSPHAQTR